MLYEAKQGSKAYEYIKSILDAEFEEHQAYMKRVEEAVGFKFEKYQGYQPNRTLTREYEITAIWVLSERYDTLDKKVWKKVDGVKLEDGYYIAIAPNKRSKQGKAIAAVLTSYKSFTHHFKILKELNIEVPHVSRFSITQLLRDGKVYLKDEAVPKSMNREDGYKVVYEGGYESWSPKDVFEKAYREVGSVNFGGAIELLKAGLAVRRRGWNGKGLFIVKQVPSHITSDIIPNMQSLPQIAKDILMKRENPHIDYTNQMLIINPDGRADSWVPSSSDVFAEDWEVATD